MDEVLFLNKLKSAILSKAGVRAITPHDCKLISLAIKRKLQKDVSVTTLKRLFGFATSNHKLSRFTLDILNEYINDETLDQPIPLIINSDDPIDWRILSYSAAKVTEKTISAVKSVQVIPYSSTIPRKFAEHDFWEFYHSHHTFSVYFAQAGYGKTIMMSHLAEHLMTHSDSYSTSSIVFIPVSRIFNSELVLFNLEEQLKIHLEIFSNQSLIDCANDHYLHTGGKLIILLDGFSDPMLKSESKVKLLEGIVNFISAIDDNKSIKLVMTMRCENWGRFHGYIARSAYLKTKWFRGNYFNPNRLGNVPLFTDKELNQVLSNNETLHAASANPKLKKLLKLPVQLQLYYKLRINDPGFNYVTDIAPFELISMYITEKLHRSNHCMEKIILLNHHTKLIDEAKKGAAIAKEIIVERYADFIKIYNLLISEGILSEQKSYRGFHPKEYVRFTNDEVFEYFVFVQLLSKFNSKVDHSFFTFISEQYKQHLAFQLRKWTIRFIIKTGNFEALSSLFDFGIKRDEKKFLILFIAENLDYRHRLNQDTETLLRQHHIHEAILEIITRQDFIDPYYKKSIELLVGLTDDEEHLLTYHSLLLVFDILSLDANKINVRAKHLASYDQANWPIHPLHIATAVHSKLAGKSKRHQCPLKEAERALLATDVVHRTQYQPSQSISHVLLLLCTAFYGNGSNTYGLANLLAGTKLARAMKTCPFSALLMSLQAHIAVRLYPGSKTDQLRNVLIEGSKHGFFLTENEYLASNVKMIQIQKLAKEGNYKGVQEVGRECLDYFKKHTLYFNLLITYNLIIEIYEKSGDYQYVNEYSYERLCFIEEKGILNSIFSPIF